MNLEKPDFLPFESLPIPVDKSIMAGKYIYSLAVAEGSMSNSRAFEILTGVPLNHNDATEQFRIARKVFQVIGKDLPNFRVDRPAEVLKVLERA